jgi:hypothetical protein
MQQEMQQKQTQEMEKKQVYEKPLLGRVSLFADQVLQSCSSNTPCDQPVPRF